MKESTPSLNYQIRTFGCKVNTYDSGLLQKRLDRAGFVQQTKASKIHILNTCAVTAEATKEAMRTIRKIKAKDPESLVVVTGCAAQVDTDQFSNLPGADLVVANSHKGDLEDIIRKYYQGTLTERVFKSNIFKKEDLEAGGGEEAQHTRTFLKIQDGCNSFCTFCVIPFARGKSRSISVERLIDKVNELHFQGSREVVLTGVHIGDYEDESGARLEDLVEAMLKHTVMPRFRVSSLEPIELSDRLLELYSDERMCKHFHMSIQAAQTKVLHDMKRKYGRPEVEKSLLAIADKVPGAFVGMDIIAGFPGETPEEFQETYDCLASMPWTKIHAFPYSPRPGTFANRMPGQLLRHEIMERAARLRDLSSDRFASEALAQIGEVKKVLVLNKPGRGAQGISRDYWPVSFSAEGLEGGQEVDVRVKGYDHSHQSRMEGCLSGDLIGKK